MSSEQARKWVLPTGGVAGGGVTLYMLYQLFSGLSAGMVDMASEVKQMRQEFSKANAAFVGLATDVRSQGQRIDRQGTRIERLRKFHEK